MKAIVVEKTGGPESLTYKDADTPSPRAGEVLVKTAAIGVNFIDVYHRTGLYPAQLPFTPGMEAAGTVEAAGPGVSGFSRGERVVYAMTPGSYAEYAIVPAGRLVGIPEGVTFEMAAAAMLQGMTAHYLTTSTYQLKSGDTALVHAAAGGVGLLLIQMAKRIGARVIGTVSTEAKAAL
ncbi:MAG TPA: alcohol dehydrogenase catalytic domain-containing protein, partial [Blastocatellia bacterium]|nr:alcohol dehydrogenase catalytic domain-containing protein [Blastocatellia bacterium]